MIHAVGTLCIDHETTSTAMRASRRIHVPGMCCCCCCAFHPFPGTYAQFAAVDEPHLARVPPAVDLTEAGGVPLVALTAWQALQVSKCMRVAIGPSLPFMLCRLGIRMNLVTPLDTHKRAKPTQKTTTPTAARKRGGRAGKTAGRLLPKRAAARKRPSMATH
jgi:hypothetical protein